MNILSFGGGVQTCAMVAMCGFGDLPKPDHIIFSDPGWESKKTYSHIAEFSKWMKSKGMDLITTSNGSIRKDLETKGKRLASLPLFSEGKGMLRRQCTAEYKIIPVQKKIRELCGLVKYQRMPKGTLHNLWLGISCDEATRIKPSRIKYLKNTYPLIEANMNRQDCLRYLATRGLPTPPKSACIGCPFHDDAYWKRMKKEAPDEFEDACKVDEMVRTFNVSLRAKTYLHRSCKPLREISFEDGQMDMFEEECEGHCGL